MDARKPEHLGMDSGFRFFSQGGNGKYPKGLMCCPCSVCENKKEFRKRDTLWNHLALNGFMSNYSLWTKHGEVGVMMEDNEEDDDGDNNLPDWDGFMNRSRKSWVPC